MDKIIIFTKYPKLGLVKTRLAKHIGNENARNLHKQMAEYTVWQAFMANVAVEVRYTNSTKDEMMSWLGDNSTYAEQVGDTLGERMSNAFKDSFAQGYKRIVLVGTDIPNLRTHHLKEALQLLHSNDCVIGKANDGGYYMVGLSRMVDDIFTDIHWGTDTVFSDTISKLSSYKYSILEELNDVDDITDIPQKISVIIPTLNESSNIVNTIQDAYTGFDVEVIVVDGGSSDNTHKLASIKGTKVIYGTSGRAYQMNLGAENATGDILLFLHADSKLPKNWDIYVRSVFNNANVVAGYFKFAITEMFRGRKLVETLTNWRADKYKLPYGDQAIFVSKHAFQSVGGYQQVPIMEDVYFMKDIVQVGDVKGLNVTLGTSGRRWIKNGLIRTFLYNQLVLILANRGYSHDKLRMFYRGEIGLLNLIKPSNKVAA